MEYEITIKLAVFYQEDGSFEIVELITSDNGLHIRDGQDTLKVENSWKDRIIEICDIYDTKITSDKFYHLYKILKDNSSQLIFRNAAIPLIMEGVRCTALHWKGGYYSTNIVTGITKNEGGIIEFHTLSGSMYRLTED